MASVYNVPASHFYGSSFQLPEQKAWPVCVTLPRARVLVTAQQWAAADRLSNTARMILVKDTTPLADAMSVTEDSNEPLVRHYYYWPTYRPPEVQAAAPHMNYFALRDLLCKYADLLIEAGAVKNENDRARVRLRYEALLAPTAIALCYRHVTLCLFVAYVLSPGRIRPVDCAHVGGRNAPMELPPLMAWWLDAECAIAACLPPVEPMGIALGPEEQAALEDPLFAFEAARAGGSRMRALLVCILRARALKAWQVFNAKDDLFAFGDERHAEMLTMGKGLARVLEAYRETPWEYFELERTQPALARLGRRPAPRPIVANNGTWQPPLDTSERLNRCQTAVADVEDLASNNGALLPACMRKVLLNARATGDLHNDERYVMSHWVSILAPPDTTPARIVETVTRGKLSPDRNVSFQHAVQIVRNKLVTPNLVKKLAIPGCGYVMNLDGQYNRHADSVLCCPHLSTETGPGAARQACHGGEDVTTHPLDYVLRQLNK